MISADLAPPSWIPTSTANYETNSPTPNRPGLRMKTFWRHAKHELARNETLMLGVIAGFLAWIMTQLLRVVFG
jgi:hypothetical protein